MKTIDVKVLDQRLREQTLICVPAFKRRSRLSLAVRI
jgi:hypothetical protein